MVRVELKNFIIENGSEAEASLPYAVKEETVISAAVIINRDMIEKRYAYLSVPDVIGEAEVFLGESRLGKISNGGRGVYDVKEFLSLGETKIRVILSEGAVLKTSPTLIFFGSAAIDAVQVAQRHEGGSVTVDIKLRTLGNADGVKAIATLVSPAGQIYYGGITKGYGSITVKDPLYWWPRGLGVQNLYRLTVNLYGESDVEDTKELFVGLRAASVFRESGMELTFNGLPFVPMGALYTPPGVDGASGALSRELISLARGGANAVFLASSVEYVPTELLDICDREGLAIIRRMVEASPVSFELERFASHPSFAYLVIPEGAEQDSLYTAARGAAPDAAIILGKECDGAIIEAPPSIPVKKTLDALGDKRQTNPLSAQMLSLGGEPYRDVLVRLADEYLFPEGKDELGYLTRHLQAKEVCEKITVARLSEPDDRLPFAVYAEFCAREAGPFPSAIDAAGHKKQLYYRVSHAFSSVFASARRADTGVEITVVNYRRAELSGKLFYRIIDTNNDVVYSSSEDVRVAALSRETFFAAVDEYIADRENACYLEYGISSYDAQYSDTMLFVKPKDFLFEIPKINLKVEGAGADFFVTMSSDKYTAGVEIDFGGADVEVSENGFDITSSAPIKLSAKLNNGKISAEELGAMIRINCLNTIGIDN